MNRWVLLVSAALLPCAAAAADRTDKMRGKGSDVIDRTVNAVRGERHEAHDWTTDRLEDLREDFDRFDRRLEKVEPERRTKVRGELAELKERVSQLEGRVKEAGPTDDSVYQDVEEKIEEIRDDFRDLRKSTKR